MPFTIDLVAAFAVAALAGGVAAWLSHRNRMLRADVQRLEQRGEELADRNWELKETEERARSFLEAQGAFILRRDTARHITYANDAFCRLAGRERDALLGTDSALPLVEQGDNALAP